MSCDRKKACRTTYCDASKRRPANRAQFHLDYPANKRKHRVTGNCWGWRPVRNVTYAKHRACAPTSGDELGYVTAVKSAFDSRPGSLTVERPGRSQKDRGSIPGCSTETDDRKCSVAGTGNRQKARRRSQGSWASQLSSPDFFSTVDLPVARPCKGTSRVCGVIQHSGIDPGAQQLRPDCSFSQHRNPHVEHSSSQH